jgi:hypothetical protein
VALNQSRQQGEPRRAVFQARDLSNRWRTSEFDGERSRMLAQSGPSAFGHSTDDSAGIWFSCCTELIEMIAAARVLRDRAAS